MRRFSAAFLLLTLLATIAVMWVGAKWATSIPEVATFALAAAWSVRFLAGRDAPRLPAVLIPLAGILMWSGVQIVTGVTVYRWPTRMAILYWGGNLAVFFCALQVFADKSLRAVSLKALVVLAAVVAVLSTVQALTSQGKIYWWFSTQYTPTPVFGPFLYRNQYAAFIEIALPVAIYLAIADRKHRVLYSLVTATLYASVIASASRAGFVLTTVELAMVPILSARRQKFSRTQLINGVLVLIGMLLWLSIPAGPETLISKFGQADPFSGRREFDRSSLRMIQERPLTGFGLGNWATAYPGYALFDDGKFANQAHNDWAQWTVEGGIPLLILMLWIAVWGSIRGVKAVWGFGIPIIFLHCLVDYPIQRPGVAVLFFVMLAAVADPDRLSAGSGRKADGS